MNLKPIFINKNSKLRSGYKIFFVAIVSVVSILVLSLILNKTKKLYGEVPFFQQCMPDVIFILVPIFAWKLGERSSLKEMGFTSGKEEIRNLVIGLIFGAASISIVFFILFFTGNISLTGGLLNPSFTTTALVDLIVYILVGAGEETLFRGYCMGVVNRYNKKWVGILVSSVLFSAAHGANPNVKPLFFINVALVGFFFSYMYYKSSSLWLPIGFHAMWDYFEGDVWGMADSGASVKGMYNTSVVHENIINGGLVGPEGGLAVTIILLLGFLVIKSYYSQNKILKNGAEYIVENNKK